MLSFRCQYDRKSTRLNSSHLVISYAVFCLKKKQRKESQTVSCVSNSSTVAPTPRWLNGGHQETTSTRDKYASVQLNGRPRVFFFFNDTATTEIYTLSLHDALPI